MRSLFVMLLLTASLWSDSKVYNGELSAYCACKRCCGDFPGKIRGQTRSGAMAKQSHTIAAPKCIPMGSIVMAKINNDIHQIGVVEDRGGAIVLENGILRLDIYFDTCEEAINFGRMKNITIYVEDNK